MLFDLVNVGKLRKKEMFFVLPFPSLNKSSIRKERKRKMYGEGRTNTKAEKREREREREVDRF